LKKSIGHGSPCSRPSHAFLEGEIELFCDQNQGNGG
jgi:hypothetical protein